MKWLTGMIVSKCLDLIIFFDDASLKLVSFGRVVIVDRLHGAILTYLANVPVIYFDQETNKLTKVLDVAFETAEICKDEKNMIIRTSSLNEALAKAKDLLAASRSQIFHAHNQTYKFIDLLNFHF